MVAPPFLVCLHPFLHVTFCFRSNPLWCRAAWRAQVREEAEAVAARCGADLRVSALAADTPAAQRDALLHAGQLVVATPGQVAQVTA